MIVYALNGGSTGTMMSQLKIQIQEKTHVPAKFRLITHDGAILDGFKSSSTMPHLCLVVDQHRFITRMAGFCSGLMNSAPIQREALRGVINAMYAISSCYGWYTLPFTIYHPTSLNRKRRSPSKVTINEVIMGCRVSRCYGFPVDSQAGVTSQMEQQCHVFGCGMTIALCTMHEKMCDKLVYIAFDERYSDVTRILNTRGCGGSTCGGVSGHLVEDKCEPQDTGSPMIMYAVQHDILSIDLVYAAIRIASKGHNRRDQRFSSRGIQMLAQSCSSTLMDTIVDVCDGIEGYETQRSYIGIMDTHYHYASSPRSKVSRSYYRFVDALKEHSIRAYWRP